jgi:hypothetical protein
MEAMAGTNPLAFAMVIFSVAAFLVYDSRAMCKTGVLSQALRN